MIARAPQQADFTRQIDIWQEAFDDTIGFVGGFLSTAISPDRALLVECKGEVASAMYWLDCERADGGRVAYVYAVATAKAYRGRGCFRFMMQKAHEKMKRDGYAGAILVPADESLWRAYERMGYRLCTRMRREEIDLRGKGVDVPNRCSLTRIEAEEYAALRRGLLPEGGLLQEGASMAFLAIQMEFYKGDGFLLAARREDERLLCKEILGDAPPAEEIFRALDSEIGVIERAGDASDEPRAAYYAMNSDPAPTYLGFAFD